MPRGRMDMPPGPGRKKGSKNKINQAAHELADWALDLNYRLALKERLLQGKSPHMETLLHHYKYGKPRETMDINVSHDLSELLQIALKRRPELTEGKEDVVDATVSEADENDQG